MPTNKNAITRYKYLDDLLSDRHHYYDIHDLVEKCNEKLSYNGFPEVTQRCIEKDINYLEYAPFYADIERFRKNGKSCIRYANPSFSIFTKEMSDEELSLLREVLNTLGQFEGLDHFTWLDNFKIGLGLHEGKKIISFSTNPYLRNSSLLGELFDIISNEQTINLKYHKFGDSNIYEVVVYPYQLKQYNDRWYLLCAPEDNVNKILDFALDRIEAAIPIPERKYVKCKIDLEEHFEDIIGVTLYTDRPLEKITLWVSDREAPYIETKPIHPSQKLLGGQQGEELQRKYSTLKNGKFFEIECIENYELIRELCSYGKELIVLSPQEIRQQVYERISGMVLAYDKVNFESE